MLTDIASIPADLLNHWPGFDQGLYTSMFLAGRWGIQLDYNNSIFQSWGLVEDPAESVGRRVVSKTLVEKIVSENVSVSIHSKWRNSYNKRIPTVLHFNADGKSSGIFKAVSKSLYNFHNKNLSAKREFEKNCLRFHKIIPIQFPADSWQ